jgi:flagellar biosynthesis/type III secretory pathway protein FliH
MWDFFSFDDNNDRKEKQEIYQEGYEKGKEEGLVDQLISGFMNVAADCTMPSTDTYKTYEKGRLDGNEVRNKRQW